MRQTIQRSVFVAIITVLLPMSFGARAEEFSWDKWMEITGNKPMPAPKVGQVKVTGSSWIDVNSVRRACYDVMRSTRWAQPASMGMNADGVLSAVEYFPQVSSADVSGNAKRSLPRGNVTPARISFVFPRNVSVQGAKVYLFKDTFGEVKCLSVD